MAFELDEKGGAEILKHAAVAEITRLTKAVEHAAGPEASSEVITTDRAHGVVRVPAYRQAKDGALTRGAAAAGLEVHPR
jgi:hypothetical protein